MCRTSSVPTRLVQLREREGESERDMCIGNAKSKSSRHRCNNSSEQDMRDMKMM